MTVDSGEEQTRRPGDEVDPETSWVGRARKAIALGRDIGEVELVETNPPPLADVAFELSAIALAGVAWAGAAFREIVAGQPLDPIALLLRALAFGLTLRAGVAVARAARRLRLWLTHRRHRLALAADGLVYRAPGGAEWVVPREAVLGVREQGDWRSRSRGRGEPVYLVARRRLDARSPVLALPPVFAGGPGLLAETLMRHLGGGLGASDGDRGVQEAAPTPPGLAAAAGNLPSRVYDEAAAGRPGPGVIALRHGRGWWLRVPQAALLLGLAIFDGFLRIPPAAQTIIAPVALPAALLGAVLIPLIWLGLAGRQVRARKGLSLVFTPENLLLRTRSGVISMAWDRIRRVRITGVRTWSLFTGSTIRRVLVIDRDGEDAGPVRYEELFLGVPGEVIQILVDAYARGAVGRDDPGLIFGPLWYR